MRVPIGSLEELRTRGCLTGKAGTQPICVFWHDGRAFALDDRCPHMGFPLHRGTVENGLVTCHWHHARFDLSSGGTLDPFADDVRAYPVVVEDDRVVIVVEPDSTPAAHHRRRLEEGMEHGITLVIAKAVLGLLGAGTPDREIVRAGVEWGTTYRGPGWGSGLTVLVAMANLIPLLDPADRPLALVHGLAFVSRDTVGRPPRFPLTPLGAPDLDFDRLRSWYRRFIDSRSPDAAERTLLSAVDGGLAPDDVESMMVAAITDHVFIDEGHTLDFTNKAFETIGHLGWETAPQVLATLVLQTARARRHEEEAAWRHPHDLAGMVDAATARLPDTLARAATRDFGDAEVEALAWEILGEDPARIVASVEDAIVAGATPEQLGRAVAYAAALRITRFHVQNDHGDWDVVHHAFTAANALHQSLARAPSTESLRGVFQGALRVFLDRFLNVPAARLPARPRPPSDQGPADLAELQSCWDEQGRADDAGGIVYRYMRDGGDHAHAVAALGQALLVEDAGFHWFQICEAAARQAQAWPAGSEPPALILAGAARFLAAHTPTRRELAQVVRIATRLGRGEILFEAEDEDEEVTRDSQLDNRPSGEDAATRSVATR